MAYPDPWRVAEIASPWPTRLALLHRILSPFGYTAWRDKRRPLGLVIVPFDPMFR